MPLGEGGIEGGRKMEEGDEQKPLGLYQMSFCEDGTGVCFGGCYGADSTPLLSVFVYKRQAGFHSGVIETGNNNECLFY